MRKIVIFGTGKGGKHLYHQCIDRDDIEVVAFLDNNIKGSLFDIPVYHPNTFFEKYEKDSYEYYITAGAQKTVKIMLDILQEVAVQNVYLLYDVAGKNEISLFKGNEMDSRWVHKIHFEEIRPTIHYFEVPITDKCNLNCRGCIFGCNSAQMENNHVPKEQIIKDIRRMSELFCDVPWIRILGGEPLMHPDLIEILREVRNSFPDSEVDLCTNGLLVPHLDDASLMRLKELRVTIHVSGYPPTEKMEKQINETLSQAGLPYTYLNRPEFFKFYTLEPIHAMRENFDLCPTSGCWEVYRGKIMRCSAVIAVEKLNKQFGTEYQVVENVDWFSLYDDQWDGIKLKNALSHASHCCKYCDLNNKEMFEWFNGGEPKLEDYIL
ncbi:MAG: radical SAM protein [Lachnospiraceae bacterium]|nr:radical SAM protein [Lachnospiraceae bacterium]